jgi:hypothetical protein
MPDPLPSAGKRLAIVGIEVNDVPFTAGVSFDDAASTGPVGGTNGCPGCIGAGIGSFLRFLNLSENFDLMCADWYCGEVKDLFKSTPTLGTLSACCAPANDRKVWIGTKATPSRKARDFI